MSRVLGKSLVSLQVILAEVAFVIMEVVSGEARGRAFAGIGRIFKAVDLTRFWH
jgi:hypothetical protein